MTTNAKAGIGPVYRVPLDVDPLPVGGMLQAMPNERDLYLTRSVSERTAAGYEVLLHHYRELREAVNKLKEHHETWRDRFDDSYKASTEDGVGDEKTWSKYERECSAIEAMHRLGLLE